VQTPKHLVIGVVLLVLVILGFWQFWPKPAETQPAHVTEPAEPSETARPAKPATHEPPVVRTSIEQATTQPAPTAPKPAPLLATQRAHEMLAEAVKLIDAGQLIQARTALSAALFSGNLEQPDETRARQLAEQIAEKTILSPQCLPGDPYCDYYVVKFGDKLAKVVEQLKLYVPHQLLLRINHVRDARRLRAGQRIKIVRGPFHAIITKHTYTMDIFLQRDDLPRVFIKRLLVGLGKDGSTPVGMWRVAGGEKLIHPVWYPSANSSFKGPISYGQDDYAFGAKGLWIGLEGMDENTRYLTDYGIHSTNDPTSIGQSRSEGCIRLADEDIELVFSMLYEKYSTVEVRP